MQDHIARETSIYFSGQVPDIPNEGHEKYADSLWVGGGNWDKNSIRTYL